MDTTIAQKAVDELAEMRSRIDMDIAFQRNFVWDMKKDKDARMSKLIRSIFLGRYIPNLLFWDNGEKNENGEDVYALIDGKQRITSTFKYIQGGFRLSDKIEYGEYDVAGKYFDELPEDLQKKILRHKFNITFIKNATLREIEDNFVLINEGVLLTKTEKSVAKIGSENNERINELLKTPYFKKVLEWSNSDINKLIPRNVVLQIIALRKNDGQATELGNIDIISDEIAVHGVDEGIFETIERTSEYIGEGITGKHKFNKVDMPMIFEMAVKAQEMGISPEKFGGWMQQFFKDMNEFGLHKEIGYLAEYKAGKGAGTGKVANVAKRLNAITRHFEENAQKAKDYVKPEETTKRAGRPSKRQKKSA